MSPTEHISTSEDYNLHSVWLHDIFWRFHFSAFFSTLRETRPIWIASDISLVDNYTFQLLLTLCMYNKSLYII